MRVYTYSEARRKLASLLEQAVKEGEVKIKRRDGQTFVIRPDSNSPCRTYVKLQIRAVP
jgi:PHD/YefM family antitoxin component YafN of YafNO toxin-antitoxin module